MAIFRNPFGFDAYGNQGTGGLAALLQQAIEQQRLKQQEDKTLLHDVAPDRFPAEVNNSLGGLFARFFASQSYAGSLPTGNSASISSAEPDANFRQLSRLPSSDRQAKATETENTFDPHSSIEAQPNAKSEPDSSRVAQALVPPIFGMPYTIFARPPVIWRNMTPLEELPKGSTGGPGAGKRFPDSVGRIEEGQPMPRCTYCRDQTTREKGPKQYQREHVEPRSKGGNNTEDNYTPGCRTCNLKKLNRNPTEWYESNT